MINSRCIFAVVVLFFPALSSAQTTSGTSSDKSDTFRIGALLCQTGDCADWGTAALNGATLAAEEINARGGVLSKKIELVAEDTGESLSGAKAVTGYRVLRAKGISYFIGPSWAPGALAIAPIAAKDPILIITPSASAREFSASADHMFNIRSVEDDVTRALALELYRRGMRRAAILASQQPAMSTQGKIFEEEFKRLGGEVTLRLEPEASITDLRTEILKIVFSRPDVVFLMNYTNLESSVRALSNAGYHGAKAAISLDDARIAQVGNILDGLIVSRAPEPSDAFGNAYGKRFQIPPGLSAEGGYDAIHVLASAIVERNSFDIEEIKSQLAEGTFNGSLGQFRFNTTREVILEPVIREAKDGKLVSTTVRQ